MLTYGGLGLLLAGLFFMLGGTKMISDIEKAEKLKKQAPILAGVGAAMLGLAVALAFLIA